MSVCLLFVLQIFLRELISNASDALDKIRLLSVTDKDALNATPELVIRIKADKDAGMLHVIDTGIGMTKSELERNLGTIARSGTSEFLEKMDKAAHSDDDSGNNLTDMIGQFGVGFYSSFLVADRVIVTSKSNDDKQYIWESDSSSFTLSEDPRGDTLKRGTHISLVLKEEARDYLEEATLKELVKKYSQFINFPIYMWTSKTEQVEVPTEDDEEPEKKDTEDEAAVEEEKEEKPKTKTIDRTVWDWELINDTKPIWLRKPHEVEDDEYTAFYKSISKDYDTPLAKIHFSAEGEVTFRAILYLPKAAPPDLFSQYGKKTDFIKLYVRRVFITDDFSDMMPKYLSFVRGVVDSDDLPLNVSRETLQQHKLLKVIKKKLVRKTLDMLKKLTDEEFETFWKEYSTSVKLGVIEDSANRTRLAKLLRFHSSNDDDKQTTLADYISRMKEKQEAIYFVGCSNLDECKKSPFAEKLLKKGHEVLYLAEPIDEYTIQSLPEFEGKRFQNVAKEGLKVDESEASKEFKAQIEKEYEPLMKWLKEDALKDMIEKATISDRLADSPAALVASSYGWSGNMERIMRAQAYAKSKDPSQDFYSTQKKTLELNPRHPLVKELRRRYDDVDAADQAKELAESLLDMATVRSGYFVKDTADFSERFERMLRMAAHVPLDEPVEQEPEFDEAAGSEAAAEEVEDHDEL